MQEKKMLMETAANETDRRKVERTIDFWKIQNKEWEQLQTGLDVAKSILIARYVKMLSLYILHAKNGESTKANNNFKKFQLLA
jgi:Holliday junction resolvase-like predicted endonuclease